MIHKFYQNNMYFRLFYIFLNGWGCQHSNTRIETQRDRLENRHRYAECTKNPKGAICP